MRNQNIFIIIFKCLVRVASCVVWVHTDTHTHTHTRYHVQKVACAVQLVHLKPQKMFELRVKIAVSPVLSERMPLLC